MHTYIIYVQLVYSEVVLCNVPLRYISVPQPPTPVSLSEHLTNDLLARIGVNGFENPMRDSKVTEFKSQVYIPTHPKCNTIYMYLDICFNPQKCIFIS